MKRFRFTVSLVQCLMSITLLTTVVARAQATKESDRKKQLQAEGVIWESDVWKSTYRPNLSDEEKVAGLSRFWAEVKFDFAYFDNVPDLDWDKTYLTYLSRVLQTKSTLEYYRALQEMCALLKDGHTNVYLPDELWREMYARPPIRTRLLEGKVIVSEVYGEKLRELGLVPGLEIVSVENVPVKQYAEQFLRPYISSSTAQGLEVSMYSYALAQRPGS